MILKVTISDKLEINNVVSDSLVIKIGLGGLNITQNIGGGLELGETSTTAGRGDWNKTAYDHSQNLAAQNDVQNNNPTVNNAWLSPLRAFQGFVYWIVNVAFSGLTTTDKTIQGAVNELNGKVTNVNGNSQLVKTTIDGKLPIIDGSNLTGLPSSGAPIDSPVFTTNITTPIIKGNDPTKPLSLFSGIIESLYTDTLGNLFTSKTFKITGGNLAVYDGSSSITYYRHDGLFTNRGDIYFIGSGHWRFLNDILKTMVNIDTNYGRIAIGINSNANPIYEIQFVGEIDNTIGIARNINGNSIGTKLNLLAGGATIGATNKKGGAVVLSDGIGTGNATGDSIIIKTYDATISGTGDQTATDKVKVLSNGDIELLNISQGVIMKSPDGTRYKMTIANGGTLTINPA